MNALAGLMNPAAVGQSVTDSFNQGRETARQSRVQNALAAYAANPSEQTAVAIAPYDPGLAIQLRGQEQQKAAHNQQAQQQQHRADFPILGRLLDHATDEGTYQQALQAAHQYGIDVSTAPPNFDPNWVGQQKMILQAIQTPQGQEALSNAGKQATDMGYKPGTPEFTQVARQLVEAALAQPYTGSQGETRLYQPHLGAMGQQQPQGPQPGSIEDGYRFKGGNPADPGSWEPVWTGGPTQPASGGFHPVGLSGERVTSTLRSAAHNKAVGGVANSYHLRGLARDSVPPPGMGMTEYYHHLKAANPNLDVINEGDHVHMEPRG
jgi:hypothetical protein